jgi:hypothetical protein
MALARATRNRDELVEEPRERLHHTPAQAAQILALQRHAGNRVAGPAADGSMRVRISITDPYEWHPDEDRGTQCLHQTMERQKQKGAADYNAVGSGDVQLTL